MGYKYKVIMKKFIGRQPRDLERDHIEAVLRKSVELLYGKKE